MAVNLWAAERTKLAAAFATPYPETSLLCPYISIIFQSTAIGRPRPCTYHDSSLWYLHCFITVVAEYEIFHPIPPLITGIAAMNYLINSSIKYISMGPAVLTSLFSHSYSVQ